MTSTAVRPAEPGDVEWRLLIENAPDAILVAAADGRLTFVNDCGCRWLGRERSELYGSQLSDVFARDEAQWSSNSRSDLPRVGPRPIEGRLLRRDGTWIFVEATEQVLPDGQWLGFLRDVGERKTRDAERDAIFARTESDRQWLQTVLDTLPLGVMLFHPGGRLSFNHRTEELLGMSLSPTGGTAQYASRILFPDGRPVPPDRLVSARVLRNGETIAGEQFLIERTDGSRVPVLGSAAPMRDADGRVIGAAGVFQDISEIVRMGQAIRANERLLQDIINILPVGVWLADRTGRLVRTNPTGERIWGGARYLSIREFGQYKGWWVDTGKPIEAEEWGMARAITRGETSTAELIRIQSFDGSFKTILHSAAPLRDETGSITGAIVVNEDITALHEAQENRRASEQLLRTVFDLLPVGLWVTDREGRITLANPAGGRMWAGVRYVGPEDYAEYKAWWVETGALIASEEWALQRAIRHGETSRGELLRIQCFDGSFKTVINWAAPIRSDAGEIVGAVAVNEDVTSLQHTQEQLRAAVREREEILAIVTHDLRTPLNSLMLGAAAAERQASVLPGGERVRALAATLVDISRHMSGLVDDLLAVAVGAAGGPSMLKPAPIGASLLLARAAEAVRPLLAREGLELEIRTTGDLPQVNVDADRMLRVFANLLDNALKHTVAPGRITLAADEGAGGVLFCVSNSGTALPEDQLREMFQPFWQADRDWRGAGLGLSICRSIVEAHGGSIWAEPAEGERVRVCFVLPR